MQIVEKKVADLKAYDKNPRRNDKAVDAVAESIKKFGFKVPIVIDKDDVIVAGHTRLKASIKLGIEYVPCVVADDLTPEQVRAFRLADNRTAEIASWDDDLLADELKSLDGIIDMSDFGFDLELTKNDLEKIEEDDIPAEPPTRCKTGDLWKLGDHLLYCGSSTERERATNTARPATCGLPILHTTSTSVRRSRLALSPTTTSLTMNTPSSRGNTSTSDSRSSRATALSISGQA